MFRDADLPVFFRDFGAETPVIWNNEPAALGILESNTDIFAHGGGPGGLERNTLLLHIPYNAFSAIPAPRDPINVGGVDYTVLSLPENRDRQVVDLYLKRVS